VSVFLVGGGVSSHLVDAFDAFVAELEGFARSRRPQVLVVLSGDEVASGRFLAPFAELLSCRGVSVVPVFLGSQTRWPAQMGTTDGVIVGGGRPSAYLEGLRPFAADLRALVASGVPYMGFSAGAMIAPQHALCGGFQVAGRQVCPDDVGEGLTEVTFQSGLGMVPFTVDTHTETFGTLGRAVAVACAEPSTPCLAIDEHTAVVVDGAGDCRALGPGAAWWVNGSNDGAVLRRVAAG